MSHNRRKCCGVYPYSSTTKNAPVRRKGRDKMHKRKTNEINEIDTAEVPEFVYESLARSLLPVIQKYYESDEGKRAFAEWKKMKDTEKSRTT